MSFILLCKSTNFFSHKKKYEINLQMKKERRTSDQHVPIDKIREELRQEMEQEKCKDIENLQAEHAKQVRQLKERHQQLISEIKKKQWVCVLS